MSFGPGQSEKILQVEILADNIPEPDESFEVILASPKNGLSLGIPHRGKLGHENILKVEA